MEKYEGEKRQLNRVAIQKKEREVKDHWIA